MRGGTDASYFSCLNARLNRKLTSDSTNPKSDWVMCVSCSSLVESELMSPYSNNFLF